jgi:hypothetical protein
MAYKSAWLSMFTLRPVLVEEGARRRVGYGTRVGPTVNAKVIPVGAGLYGE